jgi:hypothetical protein
MSSPKHDISMKEAEAGIADVYSFKHIFHGMYFGFLIALMWRFWVLYVGMFYLCFEGSWSPKRL